MAGSKKESYETYQLFIDNVTPATRLLEKRRYMFEVQEALDAYKEEFARREEAFRRREESLRKKDLNLQTSLINYNKIITNNEAKRYRALQRRMQEEKARQLKEREIERLRYELQHQEDELTAMKYDLDRVVRYRKYLKTVQEKYPDEFPEIDTIETRYTKLEKQHAVLEAEQSVNQTQLQQVRRAIDHLTEDGSSRQLLQTLQAATLSKAYESQKVAADSLVRSETDAAARHSTRTSETGIVLAAIRNVFQRCTQSGLTHRLKHEHDIMRDTSYRGGGLPAKSPAKKTTGAAVAGPSESAARRKESGIGPPSPMRRAGAAAVESKGSYAEGLDSEGKTNAKGKAKGKGGDEIETDEQRLKRLAGLAEKELEVVGAYVRDFYEIVKRWKRDQEWYLANVGAGGAGASGAAFSLLPSLAAAAGAGAAGGRHGGSTGGHAGIGASRGLDASGSHSLASSSRSRIGTGSSAGMRGGGLGASASGLGASGSGVPGFSSAGRGTFAGTITAAAGHVKTQPGVFYMRGATRKVAQRKEAAKQGRALGASGSRGGVGASVAGSGAGGAWGESTLGGGGGAGSVSMSGSRYSGSEFG